MIIRTLYKNKPRTFYGQSKNINSFAIVKVNVRSTLAEGDTVYISKKHGNRIELFKVDKYGRPDKSVLYIDRKQNYLIPER